jgi:hypothetical protein
MLKMPGIGVLSRYPTYMNSKQLISAAVGTVSPEVRWEWN